MNIYEARELKYVVISGEFGEVPIILLSHANHADVVKEGTTVISAGFCKVWPKPVSPFGQPVEGATYELQVSVWGNSTTLKTKARIEEDTELLELMFNKRMI